MVRDEFEGCGRSRQKRQGRQFQMKHRRGPGGGQYRGAMGHCILQMGLQRGGQREFAGPTSENDCRREGPEREVETWRTKVEVVPSGWKRVVGWEVGVVKRDQAFEYGR
jgi:hypothetical protein